MFTRATGNSYNNQNSPHWVVPAAGSAASVELGGEIRPGETNRTRGAQLPQTLGEAGEPTSRSGPKPSSTSTDRRDRRAGQSRPRSMPCQYMSGSPYSLSAYIE